MASGTSTPIYQPNVFPSSVNSVAGKLLSERNLSYILRSICNRHFIYTKDKDAETGNFNLDVSGSISSGMAVIDGYIITVNSATSLNIPYGSVPVGQIVPYYIAIKINRQLTPENEIGNNDPIFASISFEFLDEPVEDSSIEKYLYLYKVDVNNLGMLPTNIQDLRTYMPFDSTSIMVDESSNKTLYEAFEFISEHIRGVTIDNMFDVSDRTIDIEGENGIYDRLKYQFELTDYPNKPFINEMIVPGNENLYDEGHLVTLNSASLLPSKIMPLADYNIRGSIYVNPNRITNAAPYNPAALTQVLVLQNGELYCNAEVNQNAFSKVNIKNSSDASINIDVPAGQKVDTLTVRGSENVSVTGAVSESERQLSFDLSPNISVQSLTVSSNVIDSYNDPNSTDYNGLSTSNGWKSKTLTVEQDARVGADLEVTGDISTSGGMQVLDDIVCSGEIYAGRVHSAVYNDYAEAYKVDPNFVYQTGTVLAYDPETDICHPAYTDEDRKMLIGVVSNSYGYLVGATQKEILDGSFVPVGLIGRVLVKVYGPVMPGDLLTSSWISGVAVKSTTPTPGTILGKALKRKDSVEIGLIPMQIMLS